MAETEHADSRAGKYLLSHFFFSGSVRGTFAAYSRPQEGQKPWKVCVRVELLPTDAAAREAHGPAPITMELKEEDVQRILVVLREPDSAHMVRIPRPGRQAKELRLYRNSDEEGVVITLREGERFFKGVFGPWDGFWLQLVAMRVLQEISGGLPLQAVWDAFIRPLARPVRPKEEEGSGG
jgi:hypothetical protein